MNRGNVAVMSKVARNIALVKKSLSDARDGGELDYEGIRELLNDCQEIMAIHCDTAPIRLITGQVDVIMGNLTDSRCKV